MTDKTLVKRRPNELRDLIEGADFRAQLVKALPKPMTPERFVRIAVTSMMRNPQLMQTTKESFFRCLLDLSAMGLEPDGRQAHLIPRRNKHTGLVDCTLVVDYKGIKELLYRNQDIIDEHSDVVGDMDIFEYEFGSNKHLFHKPNVHNRGRIFAAYSHIKLPHGGEAFDVMSIEEITAIQRRSAAGDSDKSPWKTDWSEMAKKTVFKRLAKGLPLSPKTRDAMETDQGYDTIEAASVLPIRRATVGGQAKVVDEMSAEEEREESVETIDPELYVSPNDPDEVPAQQTTQAPTSPPTPVSVAPPPSKPPGPLTLVKRQLKEAGYTWEEFLALLKSVRLVSDDVKDINNVPANALHQALSDWDSCIDRLGQERAKNKPSEQTGELPI